MAALGDELAAYLTDKYAADEDNDQIINEIDDLPDSASVGGSDRSSTSSESDQDSDGSSSSSDEGTVIDDRKSRSEAERLERKKIREEKRERKRRREEKRDDRRKKKEKKERKRKRKEKKPEKEKKRRKTSRDDEKSERSSRKHDEDRDSKKRDERSSKRDDRSSSSRRGDRDRSSSRRRSPSPTASVRSFRSVHADFRYGKDERRSSSRARSRSPDRNSTRSERPYKSSSRSKRSRSRSPKDGRNGRVAKKEFGEAGARTIPPPSGLYTMKEHSGSDTNSSDGDEDDKYKGSGLSKEDKMKLLEIAKKNALNVHGGLNKNESIAIRAGGLTIEQLTAKCVRVAEGKEDPMTENIPDDMLNHPFAVEEAQPEQLTFRPIFLKPKQVDPLALPADASMAALTKSFPVSAGIQHREVINDYDIDKVGVGEWTEGGDAKDDDDSDDDNYDETEKNGENGEQQMSMVDIQSAIADRVNAMRKLQENPEDTEAMNQMETAQELLSNWTGGTGPEDNKIMPMSWAELNSGNPAWAKKEQFHVARKVEGLGKKLLMKMGWKDGMGLGKNAQGNSEPLVLDFKINREGLSSNNEGADGPSFMGRKGFAGGVVKDLSGKHPVSALMEVCSKRRWGQPEFTLLTDPGAGNNRSFLYKVRVYDTEYQPATPSLNKKTAKAASATVALQALGLVPRC